MKKAKATYKENSLFVANPTVNVKFDIVVDQRLWEVTGFLNIRTKEFTPELVGVFSVSQFSRETGQDLDEFVAALQKMVVKGLK